MPAIPGEANPQNLVSSQAQIQDLFASIQDLKQLFTTELEDIKEKLKDLTTKWEEFRSQMQNEDDVDDDPFLWTHVQTPDFVISNTKL
ncbi:type IV pili methyl-accepting chemotaxis transducer n-term domain-containing protein [Purpureocillium lilacinum]|uniref:Type IV pili methyl-accepting chemotaxis transducer n-term domain-containing protein n=1 Tax=Purpureocillium lilacinum TaxID=33203 RepID=A0A179FES2_PURLI|nr:type IV pili methyl-accepting chemotaxis transducer n-term domain-containing protein [Purpureocillium lilacinum]